MESAGSIFGPATGLCEHETNKISDQGSEASHFPAAISTARITRRKFPP